MNNILNIIDTFSPAITFITSTLTAFIVAKIQSRHEIKKTLLSFAHEDNQVFKKAFADMLAKSGTLSNDRSDTCINSALDACATFISVSPENYHPTLIELDKAIRDYDINKIENARITLIKINSNTK